MSNKVRPGILGAGGEPEGEGPQLVMKTPGTGSIEDRSQTLRSKRYLASLVHDWDGWILHVHTPPSSHGPFPSASAAASWWHEHRHALPPSRHVPRSGGSWPPGIDEDWAEHDE